MSGNGDGSNLLNPAEHWAISSGAVQKNLHGGTFNGNGCSKLLSPASLQRLQQLLPLGPVRDYLNCFQKLASVKSSCFHGKRLSGDYQVRIKEFKQAFLALQINMTPTVHILCEHVGDFVHTVEQSGEKVQGLGAYSEQAFESMHSVVSKTMLRFPANQYNDKFPGRLLRGVCYLNSCHI